MTRQPFSDIRPVPVHRAKYREVERFFASDLAILLRVTTGEVTRYARSRGIARLVRLVKRRYCEVEVCWVSRSGARLVIEHFRAIQGETFLKGKDWDALRARRARNGARKRARDGAKAAQAEVLGGLARLIGGPVSGAQLSEAGADGVSTGDGWT